MPWKGGLTEVLIRERKLLKGVVIGCPNQGVLGPPICHLKSMVAPGFHTKEDVGHLQWNEAEV
jgi:hypothetical protein